MYIQYKMNTHIVSVLCCEWNLASKCDNDLKVSWAVKCQGLCFRARINSFLPQWLGWLQVARGDRGFPFSGAALMAEMQHDTAGYYPWGNPVFTNNNK